MYQSTQDKKDRAKTATALTTLGIASAVGVSVLLGLSFNKDDNKYATTSTSTYIDGGGIVNDSTLSDDSLSSPLGSTLANPNSSTSINGAASDGSTGSNGDTSNDSAGDTTNPTPPKPAVVGSISMSLSPAVYTSITPTSDNPTNPNHSNSGTGYNSGILSVHTDNSLGYTIYLRTANGENTLKHTNSDIASTINPINNGNIETTGITLANFTTNTWGYNLGKETPDQNITLFKAIPTTETIVEDTDQANTSNTADANYWDIYNLTFGAKVDTSLPNGTYSNTVIVSILPKVPPSYTMTITANPAAGGTLKNVSTGEVNTTLTLTDVPERSTWSTSGNTLTITEPDQTKRTVMAMPDEGMVVDAWEPADGVVSATTSISVRFEKAIFGGITNMQEMTTDICSNSTNGETKALIDIRDNKSYTVKKIGEQCWMTQNLMYNGVGMTTANTDVTSTSESGYSLTAPTAKPDTASGASNTVPQYYYKTSEWSSSYGYLYNYAAATLNKSQSRTSGTAPNSICPKNWKLPTGGTSASSDWNKLHVALGGTAVTTVSEVVSSANLGYMDRFNGILGGYWDVGFKSIGSSGFWWASSVYNSNAAYSANLYQDGIRPGTGPWNRYDGFAIRCIAR